MLRKTDLTETGCHTLGSKTRQGNKRNGVGAGVVSAGEQQQAVGVGAERVEALADGQRGAVSEMDNADLQFAEGAVDVTGGPAIS